jgi:hypothetical protein
MACGREGQGVCGGGGEREVGQNRSPTDKALLLPDLVPVGLRLGCGLGFWTAHTTHAMTPRDISRRMTWFCNPPTLPTHLFTPAYLPRISVLRVPCLTQTGRSFATASGRLVLGSGPGWRLVRLLSVKAAVSGGSEWA